jgi:hypothetical protein
MLVDHRHDLPFDDVAQVGNVVLLVLLSYAGPATIARRLYNSQV